MPGALLTDLYELNMASSYLRRGMTEPATFSLYIRSLPADRGFLVSAGLEACLEYLESFSFEDEDLRYLASIGFDDAAVQSFAGVRFDGDVWAIPEGRVIYADEPIIEVTASLPVAQLVETYLLNQVTMHVTLASKAARLQMAGGGRDLVDFSFRRTQGIEAAMAIARDSAIAGFVSTSNVEAARRYGLRTAGTMAHSFIEAFDSEAEAFRAFAEDHPERTTFLVDTYDTLNGVHNAIEVIKELGITGRVGVRLDSGELEALSREARKAFDEAELPHARIFASGGLDELQIEELVRSGAPIDAFGVGTQMGVSADAPYVDSVYKLVEYVGRHVLKLSAHKQTYPGPKQVWRSGAGDLLSLREEPGEAGAEALLVRVMDRGRRVEEPATIPAMRTRLEHDLEAVPEAARRLRDPQALVVRRSQALEALAREARDEAKRRAGLTTS
jgi:nicotinate phosphoribosyltransferase